MGWGAAISAVLHLTVMLLVYFGVPSLFSPAAPFETAIPVAVYTVAEVTTLPPPVPEPEAEPVETVEVEPIPEPEPANEPDPVPPPPEPIEAVQVPPPPPEPMAAPEPVAAESPPSPSPPPPPAAPEPAQAPPPPSRKPVQVARAEPPPMPRAKPKATPERIFDNLLVDLAAKPPKPRPAPKAETPPSPVVAPRAAVTSRRDVPLSLSVVDAIRRQVEDNWNVPIGAPEAKILVVEIRIVLQPDGTVTDAQIVDRARMTRPGEEFFRAMAESAVRAVWRANPLRNLPPEQYNQWREITFTFRPPA